MTDETDATWLTLAAAARNVVTFLTLGKETPRVNFRDSARRPRNGAIETPATLEIAVTADPAGGETAVPTVTFGGGDDAESEMGKRG